MSTPATVKAQLRLLLNNANETTQAEDTTLTEANETLIAGYGVGSGEFILQEKTISENGTYRPDKGFDGFNKVIVDVPPVMVTPDPQMIVMESNQMLKFASLKYFTLLEVIE